MTVIEKRGDLFSSTAGVIGHGVNTQGYMGAGIAKSFRELYPKNYQVYKDACLKGRLNPGEALVTNTDGRFIANIASQEFPGANASLSLLHDGLTAALMTVQILGGEVDNSLAIPRIGAGIGGLIWEDALVVIEEVSKEFPKVTIEIWTL